MTEIANSKHNKMRRFKKYTIIGGIIVLFIALELILQSNQTNNIKF